MTSALTLELPALLSHLPDMPGAVARPIEDKIGDVLHAKDFGAVGDGKFRNPVDGLYYEDAGFTTLSANGGAYAGTDDTDALKALFAAMREQGKAGMLGGAGLETKHRIRCGEWEWGLDNIPEVPLPGLAGPTLYTAGTVRIMPVAGSGDEPMLNIHNDSTAGYRFVHGGYIGPLQFEDDTGDTAPNRHAINLYGVQFMYFAPIYGNTIKGDLIHVEAHGDMENGDGWHVLGCHFESLTLRSSAGWVLNNASWSQFFNGNYIGAMWAVNGQKGAWIGPGAGNYCRIISVQGTRGWAVDWTPQDASGNVQGNILEYAEFDGPEYGMRINGVQHFVAAYRVVHRTTEDALPNHVAAAVADPTENDKAWPKIALKIGHDGGFAGRQALGGEVSVYHYFRDSITDLTRHKVGNLVDLSNDPNNNQIEIRNYTGFTQSFADHSPGFKIDTAKYIVNPSVNATRLRVMFSGQDHLNTNLGNKLIARMAAGNLPQFYDYASRLDFSNVQLDENNNYSVANKEYTVRAKGTYGIAAHIMVDATGGTLFRLGIMVNGTVVREVYKYANAAGGVESFEVRADPYPLNAGDKVSIAGACATLTPLAGGTAGVGGNNRLEIKQA